MQPTNVSSPSSDWHFSFPNLDEAASQAFAGDLAEILRSGDIIALDGNVGMGKSTLARALLRSLADDELLEVPSPTFTLVQNYDLDGLEVSHFDLYRISDFEELYEIGFEESWQEGCTLVEWPDRGEELLPASTLWLHFEDAHGEESSARHLTLQGNKAWKDRLERPCQKRQLLIDCDWGNAKLSEIDGDLSTRSYQRAYHSETQQTAILMDMPKREPGPVLADGRRYDLIAHRVTELAPMITVAENLEKAGLTVPKCFGHQLNNGLALWEDFGSECLSISVPNKEPKPITERYEATVIALADFHQGGWQSDATELSGSGGPHLLSNYDRAAFEVELDIFLDWYWPFLKGQDCPATTREIYVSLWQPAFDILIEAEQCLVLRDVQNPNCFWLEKIRDDKLIGFIDFQDCLIGPSAYDVAALCLDARISIEPDLEKTLKAAYMQHRSFDREASQIFEQSYALCGAQRTSKNLGAFARAKLSLGKSSYMAHIPRGIGYLARCLAHPELADLSAFYNENKLLDLPSTF
ncbi:MAG TPA: tRNA (adenosine(37)-N6)-threonylcarbamoyltransferase complex ATPase subunit type 1 TsaE [Rhizobiales bacterium]|nr:tRNA (adenosine(37)-N6)-threonylcarbamoyltransferase complex ATPase subunit type 1 TsaE [Hyphomicrobiales bacterium]